MAVTLTWIDWAIFAALLLVSLGIGLYHALAGGKQRTTEEFIMANRKLRVIPTAMSILASNFSAIIVLGTSAEMYTRGIQYWPMALMSYTLAAVIGGTVFTPLLYPLRLTSVNEYLEMRFQSQAVRLLGALLTLLKLILYTGVSLYAPSVALEGATGLPLTVSVPLLAIVCTVYTSLGGMRAVVWTDVFQLTIMIIGVGVTLVKAVSDVGGIERVFHICSKEGRLNLFDWSPDPTVRHTFWGFLFGYTIWWIPKITIDQAAFQRFASTRSMKGARCTIYTTIAGAVVMISLCSMLGLSVFAYYAEQECDPLAGGLVKSPNQILIHYVRSAFENVPGFAGLFLATLYSGALSTISTNLSSIAAVLWKDILQKRLPEISDFKAAMLNRALVLLFGAVGVALSFMVGYMSGPIIQISTTMLAPVVCVAFGIFLLGGVCQLSDVKGTIVGAVVGLAVVTWIVIGANTIQGAHPRLPAVSTRRCLLLEGVVNNITDSREPVLLEADGAASNTTATTSITGFDKLYSISYIWYSFIGTSVTCLVGLLVSLLPPHPTRTVPDHLLLSRSQICRPSSLYEMNETPTSQELQGLFRKKVEKKLETEA